jgi:Flp pilus assembly protein TadD
VDCTNALELNPKDALAYRNRGGAKVNLGDHQGAIQDCTKAIELDPKDADTYNSRGVVKLRIGDNQGALIDLTKAIELNPKDGTAYSNRGAAKFNLGDKQGSIVDSTKAIELDPKNADAYRNRGLAKFNLGDNQGGILDLRKAGELGAPDAWDMIKSVSSNNQVPSRSRTTYVAPSRPAKDFLVTHFDYDDATKKGVIAVRTYGRGIKCREWLVKNIGAICSSKNVTLQAGSESKKGGRYRILDEKIENDILTVQFESAW